MKTNDELRMDVLDEIKWDPQLKAIASDIGVTAKDGVVTLSGLVSSYSAKLAAEKAAQRVRGVKVVAMDIEVKVPGQFAKSDIEIAQAVRNALTWHSAVNEDQIEIKVDNGYVYLDGKVEWEYMKKAAESAISDLSGIRGVINRVIVSNKAIDSAEIKRKIASAYHRSATVDAAGIQVSVTGTRVILSGKVRTWAERSEAENVAWSAPGVITVENKIEVEPVLELIS